MGSLEVSEGKKKKDPTSMPAIDPIIGIGAVMGAGSLRPKVVCSLGKWMVLRHLTNARYVARMTNQHPSLYLHLFE
jgi:hypothetical protein